MKYWTHEKLHEIEEKLLDRNENTQETADFEKKSDSEKEDE